MTDNSLTIAFAVDRTPDEAFAGITDVRGCWSGEIDGPTDELGAEFTYRYDDMHRCTQRITELIPGRRVAWHVVDGYPSFVADATEWTGTDITFDIVRAGDGTEVRFTHVGLAPRHECFESCSSARRFSIATSLRSRIVDGSGRPNPKEDDPS
jgi:hypothetical protein